MVNKCRDWNLPGHIDEIIFGGNSTFTEVFLLPLCGAGALAFLLWCSLELNQGTKHAALLAALSDISSKHLKGHSGETGFWPGYQPTRNIRNPAPHTFLTWWENYFGRWVNYKYFLIIIFFNKKNSAKISTLLWQSSAAHTHRHCFWPIIFSMRLRYIAINIMIMLVLSQGFLQDKKSPIFWAKQEFASLRQSGDVPTKDKTGDCISNQQVPLQWNSLARAVLRKSHTSLS